MPLKEHLWEKHPGGETLLRSKRGQEPGCQAACLSVSGSLAFGRGVGSCHSAHPKLLLNQREKAGGLQAMPRNGQRVQGPGRPHGLLALRKSSSQAAPALSSPKLRPCKHNRATQPGLASCRRKASRCCHRGSRGEAFRREGLQLDEESYHTDLSAFLTLLDTFPKWKRKIG